MQVIRPSTQEKEESFQRNLLFSIGLSAGGFVVLMLPLTGLLPGNIALGLGWGGLIIAGLGLVGVGSWYGRLVWVYYDKQQIQKQVTQILAQSLSNEFTYLCNLSLIGNRAIGDTGVLLGPHGALVLQVYRFAGSYACEGDTWYKYSPRQQAKPEQAGKLLDKYRLDDSPNWQVIRATREVKAWLSVRELPQVPIQPVVVLARGKMSFSRRPSCAIVQLGYLDTYIKNYLMTTVPVETEIETVDSVALEQIVERLRS